MIQQDTDNQSSNNARVQEFFRSALALKPAGSRSYSAAVTDFSAALVRHAIAAEAVSESVLIDWITARWSRGRSLNTSLNYLDCLRSLYATAAKAGLTDRGDAIDAAFRAVRPMLRSAMQKASADSAADVSVVNKLLTFSHKEPSSDPDERLSEDILHQLLMHPTSAPDAPAPDSLLTHIALLRQDARPEFGADILEHYRSSRRRYALPLRQPELTPRQLHKALTDRIRATLTANGISILGPTASVEDTVAALRLTAALHLNFHASRAVSALRWANAALLLPLPVAAEAADEADAAEVNAAIAAMLDRGARRWYALRLRRNADYEDITRRLAANASSIATPELFYPCREIAKRIGRRLVYRNQPLINDVVFMRSRRSDLRAILAALDDLAWAYTTRNPDGTVAAAVISQAQMDAFQNTIGIFTEDMEVFPLGTLTPMEGEPVAVIGGTLIGRRGRFDTTVRGPHGTVLYRLLLPGNNGVEWRATLTPRLVRQLAPSNPNNQVIN